MYMSASLAFLKHGISLSISLPFFQNKKGQENSMSMFSSQEVNPKSATIPITSNLAAHT
jgi:hypothetical protein